MIACDKHPSARAKAEFTFDSGGTLYACGHCTVVFDAQMKAKGLLYLATRLEEEIHAPVNDALPPGASA